MKAMWCRFSGGFRVFFPRSWRLALLVGVGLNACVMVPRTEEHYDQRCRMVTRQVVLKPEVVANLGNCSGRDCEGLLVVYGVITAASVVVSGSVALVGNLAYWVEKQGRCDTAPSR